MSHLIQLTLKGGFKYFANIFYFEKDDPDRWRLQWEGLKQNGTPLSKEYAEGWLKEIESVQGHLTL